MRHPVLRRPCSKSLGIWCVLLYFQPNCFGLRGESYKLSKWAINAIGYSLRYVQVSKLACDFIGVKKFK